MQHVLRTSNEISFQGLSLIVGAVRCDYLNLHLVLAGGKIELSGMLHFQCAQDGMALGIALQVLVENSLIVDRN